MRLGNTMNTHKKRYVYYMRALISICLLTILDQITKYAAVGNPCG